MINEQQRGQHYLESDYSTFKSKYFDKWGKSSHIIQVHFCTSNCSKSAGPTIVLCLNCIYSSENMLQTLNIDAFTLRI